MKDLDLTEELFKKFGNKKRKIGRYNVSDLYAIKAGWTKIEDWFSPQEMTLEQLKRVWAGTVNHNFIEGFLEKDRVEQKIVYKYKDIEIVGKADWLPDDDNVVDFKTSDTIIKNAKEWQLHQVRIYCTLFQRKYGHIMQPVIKDDRFVIKLIGTTERDDVWFEKEMEKLYAFHLRLLAKKDGIAATEEEYLQKMEEIPF